jgi:signal transduction histidine kinase
MPIIRNPFYLLFSLLILALGIAGLVRQIGVALPPDDLHLDKIVWPVTVGGIPAADPGGLVFLIEGLEPGESVELISPSRQQTFTTLPAYSRFYLIVTGFSGFFFWLVAFFVFVPRLHIPAVSQFYWITMLYGLGILVGGVYFQSGLAPLSLALNVVQLGSLAFLPTVFLHLAMVFPRRVMSRPLTRGLTIALYCFAAIMTVWQSWVFGQYFQAPNLANAARLKLPQLIADLSMVGQAAIAMVIMLSQSHKLEPGRERQQVRWLMLGFFVGATPYLFLRTVPQLFSIAPPFPAYIDRMFEPAIPLAFIFAVARYRFLDIDIILRRGVLYGIMAAGMVGLILGPTALMHPERTIHWPRSLQTLPVLIGVFAGILFLPLKKILGLWLDRTFFRIEHRMDQILRDFRQELKIVSSQEDLARLIHQRIHDAINPEPCLVMVNSVDGEIRIGDLQPGPGITAQCCDGSPSSLWILPDHSTCPDQESINFPKALVDEGIVLGLRLEAENQTVGCALLGRKRFKRRYVLTELKFLSEVAQASSNRLQEIGLVQKILEEKLKRTQLKELNNLKDDFLSQVAHDLRTPITSVGWSIRNLLDGLAGDIEPRQREYLESMDNSLEHLGHLVSSLLEISRLEKAEVEIPTESCALKPILDRTLDTMRPLADSAGVEIQCSMEHEKQDLVTNGAKLVEVFVNILENGVRYSPPGAALEVSSHALDHEVVLAVRDHGPGFREVGDPFDRFAQGQPSPHSSDKGYGLGLTIAREYTHLMGGTITARNHPEGGAEFTLKFPRPGNSEEGA